MLRLFGATIPGMSHVMGPAYKNNQDASYAFSFGDCIGGVVCDGCGSKPFSEFGARIGTLAFYRTLHEMSLSGMSILSPESLNKNYGFALSSMVDAYFPENERDAHIADYMLFSLVGFVYHQPTRELAYYYCGDGMYGFVDSVRKIEPMEDNKPPYFSYRLMSPGRVSKTTLEAASFSINSGIILSPGDQFIIGTDGMFDLVQLGDGSAYRSVIDKSFAEPDAYDLPRRALSRINAMRVTSEEGRVRKFPGPLKDDVTFISGYLPPVDMPAQEAPK